jgi:hypothetical protein
LLPSWASRGKGDELSYLLRDTEGRGIWLNPGPAS